MSVNAWWANPQVMYSNLAALYTKFDFWFCFIIYSTKPVPCLFVFSHHNSAREPGYKYIGIIWVLSIARSETHRKEVFFSYLLNMYIACFSARWRLFRSVVPNLGVVTFQGNQSHSLPPYRDSGDNRVALPNLLPRKKGFPTYQGVVLGLWRVCRAQPPPFAGFHMPLNGSLMRSQSGFHCNTRSGF